MKLYSNVRKLAVQRYVKEDDFNEEEPATDVFPSLHLHSKTRNCKADRVKTMDHEEECNKDYPKAPMMTPGLAHVFCRHGICNIFTTMMTAENPEIFAKFLTRRLPKNVQIKHRVFLYDNACNLHKNALKRDAHEISKFRIFTGFNGRYASYGVNLDVPGSFGCYQHFYIDGIQRDQSPSTRCISLYFITSCHYNNRLKCTIY